MQVVVQRRLVTPAISVTGIADSTASWHAIIKVRPKSRGKALIWQCSLARWPTIDAARSNAPSDRCDIGSDDHWIGLGSDDHRIGLGLAGQPFEFEPEYNGGQAIDNRMLPVLPTAPPAPPPTPTYLYPRWPRHPPRAHTSSGGRKYLGAKNPYTRIDLTIST